MKYHISDNCFKIKRNFLLIIICHLDYNFKSTIQREKVYHTRQPRTPFYHSKYGVRNHCR